LTYCQYVVIIIELIGPEASKIIFALWLVGLLLSQWLRATEEASILCMILQVDEIYVKSSFVNDFIKGPLNQ
jgi:hypothetical protein